MKKLLLLAGSLLLVALLAYVVLNFFLGSIVTAGVNRFGPGLTGTKVTLASARISPLSGSGTLKGLAVGNPAGWSDANAFYLGHIHVKLQPFSLLGDHIVIEEIVIDQPEFLYETKIIASNVGDLLKALEAATGGAAKNTPAVSDSQPIKFEVKHLSLTRGVVKIGLGPAAIPLPLPPIELNDLGTKEGGITPGQLTFAIMRSVTPEIVGATTRAAGKLGGTMGAAAGDAAKKAGEGLKKLFGTDKK